jgi:hypothetical protein
LTLIVRHGHISLVIYITDDLVSPRSVIFNTIVTCKIFPNDHAVLEVIPEKLKIKQGGKRDNSDEPASVSHADYCVRPPLLPE